jgi:hypothetical protein
MFLRLRSCAVLSLALVVFAPHAIANAADTSPSLTGTPALRPLALDPAITAMLSAVSPTDLKSIDTTLVGFGTRNLFSEGLPSKTRGVFASRDWLVAQFKAIAAKTKGRMTVDVDSFVQPKTERTPRDVQTDSVYATLKGDDPSRGTVVMSSHYDSRNSDGNDATLDAPGADDNGSGTSAVLEAARVMAQTHFNGTIVFACFDGEEQGLFGSAHFAKMLKDKGVVVEANLNNDIIGASVGHDGVKNASYVRLFSEALPVGTDIRRTNLIGTENDSPSRELARFVKEVDEAYLQPFGVNLIYRSDRFLRGGDQQSFTANGFAAVRYVEPHENFEHQHQNIRVENGTQYGDLLSYVDFDYLATVTRANVAALATLALAPAAPKVTLSNKDLGYDSTLNWDAVPGAASYEVVWRATSEPVWTHARDVGNVTNVVMTGLSKDDWIFGVRSIDARGRKSVASFPRPVR